MTLRFWSVGDELSDVAVNLWVSSAFVVGDLMDVSVDGDNMASFRCSLAGNEYGLRPNSSKDIEVRDVARNASSKSFGIVDEAVYVLSAGVGVVLPRDCGEVGRTIVLGESVEGGAKFLDGGTIRPLTVGQPEPFDVDERIGHTTTTVPRGLK